MVERARGCRSGPMKSSRRVGNLPEPVWPEFSFQEILKIAFRDRVVDRDDYTQTIITTSEPTDR